MGSGIFNLFSSSTEPDANFCSPLFGDGRGCLLPTFWLPLTRGQVRFVPTKPLRRNWPQPGRAMPPVGARRSSGWSGCCLDGHLVAEGLPLQDEVQSASLGVVSAVADVGAEDF